MKDSTKKVSVEVQGCSKCEKKLSVKVSGKDEETKYYVLVPTKEENNLVGGMTSYTAYIFTQYGAAYAYYLSLDDDAELITSP